MSKVEQSVITVGIGASAGGLEAFKVLLECLPVDTGLSFVIIQHLAAGQESMLTDILSRFTKMPVQAVKDRMSVEPDHVYVIPPGTTMTMEDRFLNLNLKGKSLKPIDTFFISLAEDLKSQSIGIVLSGTGSDGTEGLKAIKAQGGLTFAQTPNSAQYGDMPQSAISAEAVDFVLSPDNIAQELQKIAMNPQLAHSEIAAREETGAKEATPKKENNPVKENAMRFEYAGEQKTINIQVIPLHVAQYEEPFFLLLFEDVSSAAALLRQTLELTSTSEGRENVKDRQNRELREELDSTKQSLQRVIETQEATNEELRTTMEEAQSSNEELQSTNEELETAKEELQSSNEELKTLNDEVKNRNLTLAQLNDDLANLNRSVDPAIVIIDKGLKVRLFSPSAQKILNLSSSIVGIPITSIKLGITVEALGKTISDVISKLRNIDQEVQDAQGHFYEMRIRPYITQEDRIDGVVLSFVDIDDRKKLEKSQRLAAIGETAGMVGHDIRNPLQAIVSDVYLAKSDLASFPENDEKKNIIESLDAISKNTDYINKIVADLQDYAKTINPVTAETDLETLCKELLHGKDIPENIKTSCNIEVAAKKIMVDCNLLQRILENLVLNAVQAMPNGGELTLRAHQEARDIVITVQDTGLGIPDKVKPKLFTPFFTTKSKGQGLGLAVVKRMTEALGGTVAFESKEGNGTTFIIRFPSKNRQ